MSINDTYPHTYKGYNEKGETLCGIPAKNANSQNECFFDKNS